MRLKREDMPEESLYEQLDLESTGVLHMMEYLKEEHRLAIQA